MTEKKVRYAALIATSLEMLALFLISGLSTAFEIDTAGWMVDALFLACVILLIASFFSGRAFHILAIFLFLIVAGYLVLFAGSVIGLGKITFHIFWDILTRYSMPLTASLLFVLPPIAYYTAIRKIRKMEQADKPPVD
jgi:hypothetical protein